MTTKTARLIAFYLPQYHPIPENDAWWGKGFTEWTNVAKARPLFRGHYQPHIPADLGFYDLRVPETRIAQAELAREHGIEGFCYWHYWFAGRRLLERPFNEALQSGEPDFPFCLGWANQTWSGIWHGAPDRVLLEQTYPGLQDYEAHFYTVLEAFRDERYITIEGKPVFVIYKPLELPEPKQFTDFWRELALKAGLKGVYFIADSRQPGWNPQESGFDAAILSNPAIGLSLLSRVRLPYIDVVFRKLFHKTVKGFGRSLLRKPNMYLYEDYVKVATLPLRGDQYPCVAPNWDNTPRTGINGYVLHGSTPQLFALHLREAISQVSDRSRERQVVFVKSWNEWAEGNYLEPDLEFGTGYLEALQREIFVYGSNN